MLYQIVRKASRETAQWSVDLGLVLLRPMTSYVAAAYGDGQVSREQLDRYLALSLKPFVAEAHDHPILLWTGLSAFRPGYHMAAAQNGFEMAVNATELFDLDSSVNLFPVTDDDQDVA